MLDVYVELSDADLVQRIAEGHSDAEAEVCRRVGPRIRLYGLRHLRSASAADDLVQYVLLKLLELHGELRGVARR
jgi:RNA polymerase sigma-70 factor, ECF subfamily